MAMARHLSVFSVSWGCGRAAGRGKTSKRPGKCGTTWKMRYNFSRGVTKLRGPMVSRDVFVYLRSKRGGKRESSLPLVMMRWIQTLELSCSRAGSIMYDAQQRPWQYFNMIKYIYHALARWRARLSFWAHSRYSIYSNS